MSEKEEKKKEVVDKVVPTQPEEKKKEVKVSATQFASMIGSCDGVKLWAKNNYKESIQKSNIEWAKEFVKHGAIDKIPAFLK